MTDPVKVIDLKTPTRPKILVAEDEQDIATLIEDWLSDTYEVAVALNGKTAVQKAVWHQPQAILLDVVMPDMGGYDVVRLLQGTPQTKSIPVIVMTAKNFDDSTIKMIKAEGNVYGFLNKPFKPSELIKMLETVLKGGRALVPDALAAIHRVPLVNVQGTESAPETPSSGFEVVKGPPLPVEKAGGGDTPGAAMGQAGVDEPEVLPPRKGEAREMPRPKSRSPARSKDEDDSRPSRFSRFLLGVGKAALLLCVLSLALFAVAEWACRRSEEALGVPFFTPPLYPASRFNSFMPYQWNDPKNMGTTYWDDGRVVYQFNQWGLRGPDFPLVTPTGVRRILLVGGTSTFGPGVGERDTIAQRLELILNEGRKGEFQVINAGLWSLSPSDQWAFVKGQGLNFKPEAIFWLCENRPAGAPSTEGLRWLASRRWLVTPPLAESRFIQMLVQWKIQGPGDPAPKEDDPLFKDAEKMAEEQKIALRFWILPRGGAPAFGRSNPEKMLRYTEASAAFNATAADVLAHVVEKKHD